MKKESRIPTPESDKATEAQAGDMENEGQGQQNPKPTTFTLGERRSPRRRPATATRRSMRGKRLTNAVRPRDTHVTHDQAPVGIGIDAQIPNSMPRAEDDAITGAGNRDSHDRPGSGSDTAMRHFYF
jgi:hypothetical protein